MAELEEQKIETEAEVIIKDDKVERIRDLSGKVKATAEERDAAMKRASDAEKDRDFFKGFSAATSKYPGASDFQEKIHEKVKAGYEMEDATVAVLAKEGRLTTPKAEQHSPVGGSAIITPSDTGTKTIDQMTTQEKRKALEDSLQIT